MSDCAAVNPNGSIETERDTINRLVENRDELFQQLQSQKAITELAVTALEEIAEMTAATWIEVKCKSTLIEIARLTHAK